MRVLRSRPFRTLGRDGAAGRRRVRRGREPAGAGREEGRARPAGEHAVPDRALLADRAERWRAYVYSNFILIVGKL